MLLDASSTRLWGDMKKTIAVMATTLLFACAEPVPFEERFRAALETAQPGDVIEIPAGHIFL